MISDPMERLLADGLTRAGIVFHHDGPMTRNLDFYLPDADVYLELKRLHSPRISAQMERADNVIAVQGKTAVEWLVAVLTRPQA